MSPINNTSLETFSMSDALFLVANQFYSGQYDQIIVQDYDLASPEVKKYILRSYLALQQPEKVLELADEQQKAYALYAKHLQGDTSSTQELVEYLKSHGSEDPVSTLYAAISVVQDSADYAKALEVLTANLDMSSHADTNLEVHLLIVQLYVLMGELGQAKQFLKKFAKLNVNDSVVYSYSDALVNLVSGGENANQQAFYFFEEVSHLNELLRNLTLIMVTHLVMHHFPEAKSIIEDQIEQLALPEGAQESGEYVTYLVNKAKFLYLTSNTAEAEQLAKEIVAKNPSHPFAEDYVEKQRLFDEVVNKYKVK